MVVAEMFLSAFLQVLFDRLTPHARSLWDLARHEGLEKKLGMLKTLFRTIEAVLADAEEKQLTDSAVKVWLDDLRDLAYDTEDVLDEFSIEALRRGVSAKQRASTSKLPRLVPAGFKPSSLKFKYNMRSKIDAIASRLEEISKRKEQFHLEENVSKSSNGSWQATPTTSMPIEAVIYGRDKDTTKIIDFLLTNEGNYGVIPIVGMGGIGKTTLIQCVYRHEAVAEAFNKKAWICVADDFDVKRIMKSALEDLTSKPCELKELQPIQAEFERVVSGKRFLIVLDDMWDYNFNNDKWLNLRSFLRAGASGSKIIVTTRHTDVASKVGTIPPYNLNLLSNDHCWSLFKTHAFNMQDVDVQPTMRGKIIERCKGLPLAARTLGGLLCSKPTDDWQVILDSKMWSAKDGVLPVLRLSYHYLPSELKKCFAYCAIFPEDYEFTEKEMTLLWVAEGLVQPTRDVKNVNDVGSMYFQELVSRSLFQVSSNHDSQFIMHDLVHELARQVAGDTCFRLEGMLEHGEGVLKARHISYQQRIYNCLKSFELCHKAKHVRTFFSFSSTAYNGNCYLAKSVIDQLLKFKKLRVLSLGGYHIFELPDSIGDLKHLRYLDLSSNKMRYLPESTCSLYNLHVLCLKDCPYLRKLPSKMENLTNLCYLDITNCFELKEMPIGLKELKSLQNLSNFCVSKGDGRGVRELKNFKDLRGTLSISNLKDVVDAKDAQDANLNQKKLDILVLQWGPSDGGFRGFRNAEQILDMLQPDQNLKELTIKQYDGNAFSKWLGISSFSSMTLLKLESCERCKSLPPLGQLPSLKVLEIRRMKGIESVGAEFYGSTHSKVFPSLESLTFENMQEWTNWSGFEVSDQQKKIFSCLSELYIRDCPKLLGKLPKHLPLLKKLELNKCGEMNDVSSSFPELSELNIFRCEGLAGAGTIRLSKVICLSIRGDGCEELITKNLPCTIEDLSLKKCSMIERLPISLCNLKHLKTLSINGCSNIASLPVTLLFSSVIEELSIDGCDKMQYLVNEVEESFNSNSLSTSVMKKLYVDRCPNMEFLAKTLPCSLKSLDIRECDGLKFVVEAFVDNMELESIEVVRCNRFEWLGEGLNSLSHLQSIRIWDCPDFLSFPQGGLPNLKKLFIWNCENIEALPNGISNLTSLTYLEITKCPRITNFVPGEGFMANLIELKLGGEKQIRALMEWEGLDRLTSLKTLDLRGEEDNEIEEMMMINLPTSLTYLMIDGFPMLKILPSFPISLTFLWIMNCPNVEYLSSSSSSNGFQDLTSLQVLYISKCEKLKCLPKEGLPPSLDSLHISYCPLLKCLPKEGLPPSLDSLWIDNCPMVEKRCKRDKGKDWPKIANIPEVMINWKNIYQPLTDDDEETS